MKKVVKVMMYILVVAFIATFLYNNFYSDRTIAGKVIKFSEEQESKGNVGSIIFICFILVGFMVIFAFKNLLENYFDKQYNSLELDRLTGK